MFTTVIAGNSVGSIDFLLRKPQFSSDILNNSEVH